MLRLRADCGDTRVAFIILSLHKDANKQIFQNALSLNFAINMMQFHLGAWVTVFSSSSTSKHIQ